MLVGPLWILDTARFEWRPEWEGTLLQVRVSLQSALKFVLIDLEDPMIATGIHGGKEAV